MSEQNYAIGFNHQYGCGGVEQSHKKAVYFYRLAASYGHIEALTRLGFLHQFGLGVETSYRNAATLYGQAAAMGNANSQYYLGLMYTQGMGVEKSHEKAVRFFRLAADQGLEGAQIFLESYRSRLETHTRGQKRSFNGTFTVQSTEFTHSKRFRGSHA